MQVQQMFEWFLQQNANTAASIDEIMSRGAEIVDLRSSDPIYGQFSIEELTELFYGEMTLEVIRRNLKDTFLPWDSSPQYALKIWAQENHIADMPDEVRDALSPNEVRDALSLDEKMAQETAEIVAFLFEGGATEVIITTGMTSSGRIVTIMAAQPVDEEIDLLALLGGEQFDESLHDISEWTDEEFEEWAAEFEEEDLEDIDLDDIGYFLELYPDED